MAENVGELQALERRMLDLVDARNRIVDAAEDMIDMANREFDEAAVPLGRAIQEARTALQVTRPSSARRTRAARKPKKNPLMDGLTREEQEMYRQLLRGGKRG